MGLHTGIVAQYNAVLDMLGAAIERCPDDLWNDANGANHFWRVAYHALFYTHLYLQPSRDDFKPWDQHRAEYLLDRGPDADDAARWDAATCSKTTVSAYVAFCRREVAAQVPHLDLEGASGFFWLEFNKFELQLYTIRHLQQHVGELTQRLGARSIDVEWVGSRPG